jgi:hypothetical protein
VERHTRPKGVPEQIDRLLADAAGDRVAHELRRGAQVGPHSVRAGVPGQVEGDQGVVPGQNVAEWTPQTARLREAVQQDQGRAGSSLFDMEGHVR